MTILPRFTRAVDT